MPTQWSEAEQVPWGCIAPSFAGKSSYTVRADVGIGPYKVLTPQQKMTGQGRSFFVIYSAFSLDSFSLAILASSSSSSTR